MNQEKIGKLIAMLRKQKGLTQSELGAKVGVGDRAVSKWERGLTCPDISIINELSKILGITSDELLTGELSKETKNNLATNKSNKRLLFLIPIFLIIMGLIIFLVFKNKSDVYYLKSVNDEYVIEGKIIFANKESEILINRIVFKDKKINQTVIKNYEYKIKTNKTFILKKGQIDKELLAENTTIKKISQTFTVNYSTIIPVEKQKIIKDGLILDITFLTETDKMINKKIIILITKEK